MTKEQFLREAKELGIIATDAFSNNGGFDPDLADEIIKIIKEESTPEKMEEMALHVHGAKSFKDLYCTVCKKRKTCLDLNDCTITNYEQYLQDNKKQILDSISRK